MNKKKTLIFFGAHPDDETFGLGSTLAQYVISGAKVYYVCSTNGEAGTVDPELLEENTTIGQLRRAELESAADVLGLAGVFYLGYHDSGMQGAPENKNEGSLAMAPVEEVAGKAVKIIREIKPDVVITHDEGGGYGHPDHVATHYAAVKAFYAAGDTAQYPEAGPAFQPKKLYFRARQFGLMRIVIKMMPLFGYDPHHFGRNKDIDLTKMTSVEYPVHAVVRLKKEAIDIRNRAAACHTSQGGGLQRPGIFRVIQFIEKLRGPRDYFMREYPPVSNRRKEKDLFEGIA